ncbi:enoyl-CoA hydratase-related protein [Pseudorhodoferax sp. Leaf265]|uniref:enoyl-CoA hydratase-related protein n=1 Tax=Pseudorhodoferax sp. Leaf265 TaxID=1736315 RepID=UPI0006FFFD01|nr:enoyl-CoA hydratase-related protein [Pseudorhodoferax sp. Leaf265]KQP19336.1 enoyl-CoA hydratase [Pseudorhodoferax sp. Leaf265]
MTVSSTLVDVHLRDGILLITLRRENKRNAVDRSMADALDAALNRLDDDPEVRAGVLTGGNNVFCAGSDLTSGGDYVTARGGEYGLVRRRRRKPLVAAVEGIAFGGGLEIALACDMIVAADDARFALPEVCRGLVPTCGALFRSLERLPSNVANEMVLTGKPLTAARAHALGLVNRLVPPGRTLDEALVLAGEVVANAPLAVQACLSAMQAMKTDLEAAGWSATQQAKDAIAGSEDVQEGIRAFFEKRAPAWTGR